MGDAPENNSTIVTTKNSITFTFPDSGNLTYTITLYDKTDSEVESKTKSGNGAVISFTGLTEGGDAYTYSILIDNGVTSGSYVGSFTTVVAPSITGVGVSPAPSSITFTFPASTSGGDSNASYEVNVYDTNTPGATAISSQTATGNGTTITVGNLESETTYYYEYKVTNTEGTTGFSTLSSVDTSAAVPVEQTINPPTFGAEGDITVLPGPTSIKFTFSSNTSGGSSNTNYTVYIYEQNDNTSTPFGTGSVTGDGATITVNSLTPGTTYYYEYEITNTKATTGKSTLTEIVTINPTLVGQVNIFFGKDDVSLIKCVGLAIDSTPVANDEVISITDDIGTTTVGSFQYNNGYVALSTEYITPGTAYKLSYNGLFLDFTPSSTFNTNGNITSTATATSATISIPVPTETSWYTGTSAADLTNGFASKYLVLYNADGTVKTQVNVTSYTSNTVSIRLTGLTESTQYAYTLKFKGMIGSTAYIGADTKLSTFTTGAASGGGNNNGGGQTNMALEFSYDGYTGAVTQTNTITVLGEEGGALPAAFETLVVHVTPEKLSQALAYKGTWAVTTGESAGEQPRPDVKFLPRLACQTELEDMYDKLSSLGSGVQDSDARKWKDAEGDKKHRFGDIMLGVSFASSWLDDDEMPREAIRKIEEGDLVVPPLVDGSAEAVVKDLTSTDTDAPTALLQGLFEQAVASGKILGDAVAGNNQGSPPHADTGLAAAGWKQAVFAEDDSISFLVKFTFTKTRDYVIDDEVQGSGNSVPTSKTIVVGGTSYEIVANDETSTAQDKLYIVKLLAKATPVAASDAVAAPSS